MLTYLLLAKIPSADDGQTVLTFSSEKDRKQCITEILIQDNTAMLAVAEHWGKWTPDTPTTWLDLQTGEIFPKPFLIN